MIKRNNSVVKLSSTNMHQASVRFAQIRSFLKVTHYGKHHVLCIANNLSPVLGYSEDCHITKVTIDQNLIAFSIEEINNTCVLVEILDSNAYYVCEFPNTMEAD